MKLLTIQLSFLTFFLTMDCYGQMDKDSKESKINDIKEYISKVNSDNTLIEGISEGSIKYEGESGGFETHYLFNQETKEIFKLTQNEVTDTIISLTFYYKSDELVYAKAEKGHWIDNKYLKIIENQVYYSNGQSILEIGNGLKPYELLSLAMSYLKSQKGRSFRCRARKSSRI